MPKGKKGSIAVAVASLETMVESGKLGWQFQDAAKTTRELELARVYKGFNDYDYITKMTVGRGAFEKGRDSYAGSETIQDAIDELDATIEYFHLGKWFKERTAGPRLGELFEAASRARAKAGKPELDRTAFNDKYADESARKSLRAMPEIQAELALMAKEKADQKANEAVAAAAQSTSNLDTI